MWRFVLRSIAVWIAIDAVAFLALRLAWTTSRTETGWETLRDHWVAGPIGVVAPTLDKAGDDFWIAEARRIVAEHPGDAEIALGAALAIEASGSVGQVLWREGDDGAFLRDVDGDLAPARACLQLVSQATASDPTNTNLRRFQAVLLERIAHRQGTQLCRDREMLAAFEECRRHDPNNALYDYILAHSYWIASSERFYSYRGEGLEILDQARFARGETCLEAGFAKPRLIFPRGYVSILARFLSHARISTGKRGAMMACSRLFESRFGSTLRHTQTALAIECSDVDDPEGATAKFHRIFRWREQLSPKDPAKADVSSKAYLYKYAYDDILKLNLSSALPLSSEDSALYVPLARKFEAERDLHWQQAREESERKSVYYFSTTGHPWRAPAYVASERLPWGIAFAFALATAALAAGRYCARKPLPVVGDFARISWLAAAIALTATVGGLAPARILSERVQAWSMTILMIALPLGMVGLGFVWLAKRRFRFGMKNLLIATLVASILLAVYGALWRYANPFTEFPFRLVTRSAVYESYCVNHADSRPRSLIALQQWSEWKLGYATIALWLLPLSILLAVRRWRLPASAEGSSHRFRAFCGDWLRMTGSSLGVLSMALFAAYLAVAPLAVAHVEHAYHEDMAIARKSEETDAEFEDSPNAIVIPGSANVVR